MANQLRHTAWIKALILNLCRGQKKLSHENICQVIGVDDKTYSNEGVVVITVSDSKHSIHIYLNADQCQQVINTNPTLLHNIRYTAGCIVQLSNYVLGINSSYSEFILSCQSIRYISGAPHDGVFSDPQWHMNDKDVENVMRRFSTHDVSQWLDSKHITSSKDIAEYALMKYGGSNHVIDSWTNPKFQHEAIIETHEQEMLDELTEWNHIDQSLLQGIKEMQEQEIQRYHANNETTNSNADSDVTSATTSSSCHVTSKSALGSSFDQQYNLLPDSHELRMLDIEYERNHQVPQQQEEAQGQVQGQRKASFQSQFSSSIRDQNDLYNGNTPHSSASKATHIHANTSANKTPSTQSLEHEMNIVSSHHHHPPHANVSANASPLTATRSNVRRRSRMQQQQQQQQHHADNSKMSGSHVKNGNHGNVNVNQTSTPKRRPSTSDMIHNEALPLKSSRLSGKIQLPLHVAESLKNERSELEIKIKKWKREQQVIMSHLSMSQPMDDSEDHNESKRQKLQKQIHKADSRITGIDELLKSASVSIDDHVSHSGTEPENSNDRNTSTTTTSSNKEVAFWDLQLPDPQQFAIDYLKNRISQAV